MNMHDTTKTTYYFKGGVAADYLEIPKYFDHVVNMSGPYYKKGGGPDVTLEYTFMMWVKPTHLENELVNAVRTQRDSGYNGHAIAFNRYNIKCSHKYNQIPIGGTNCVLKTCGEPSIPDLAPDGLSYYQEKYTDDIIVELHKWHHVAYTVKPLKLTDMVQYIPGNSNIKSIDWLVNFYLDGVNLGHFTTKGKWMYDGLKSGPLTFGHKFSGYIDYMMAFNYVVDDKDIKAIGQANSLDVLFRADTVENPNPFTAECIPIAWDNNTQYHYVGKGKIFEWSDMSLKCPAAFDATGTRRWDMVYHVDIDGNGNYPLQYHLNELIGLTPEGVPYKSCISIHHNGITFKDLYSYGFGYFRDQLIKVSQKVDGVTIATSNSNRFQELGWVTETNANNTKNFQFSISMWVMFYNIDNISAGVIVTKATGSLTTESYPALQIKVFDYKHTNSKTGVITTKYGMSVAHTSIVGNEYFVNYKFTPGKWYHIGYTIKNTSAKYIRSATNKLYEYIVSPFVNGEFIGSFTFTTTGVYAKTTSPNCTIGSSQFTGAIADVKFFNIALTKNQIKDVMYNYNNTGIVFELPLHVEPKAMPLITNGTLSSPTDPKIKLNVKQQRYQYNNTTSLTAEIPDTFKGVVEYIEPIGHDSSAPSYYGISCVPNNVRKIMCPVNSNDSDNNSKAIGFNAYINEPGLDKRTYGMRGMVKSVVYGQPGVESRTYIYMDPLNAVDRFNITVTPEDSDMITNIIINPCPTGDAVYGPIELRFTPTQIGRHKFYVQGINAESRTEMIAIVGIKLESISIVEDSIRCNPGETTIAHYTYEPYNAVDRVVYWYSDNNNVAEVDEITGTINAMATGECNIYAYAEDGDIMASSKMYVHKLVQNVIVAKTLTIEKGIPETLTAEVLPEDADFPTITWTSDDPSIVEVDPDTGVVYGVKEGRTKIRATSIDGVEGVIKVISKDAVLGFFEANEPEQTLTSISISEKQPVPLDIRAWGSIVAGDSTYTLSGLSSWKSDISPSNPSIKGINRVNMTSKGTYIFQGTGFRLTGLKGTDGGKMRITIDGVSYTIDTYSRISKGMQKYTAKHIQYGISYTALYNEETLFEIKGLTEGMHIFTFANLLEKAKDSKGYYIYIKDMIAIQTELPSVEKQFNLDQLKIDYNHDWKIDNDLHNISTNVMGNKFNHTFKGVGLKLLGDKGPDKWFLGVTIDGVQHTVDMYNIIPKPNDIVFDIDNLDDKDHTIIVEALGACNYEALYSQLTSAIHPIKKFEMKDFITGQLTLPRTVYMKNLSKYTMTNISIVLNKPDPIEGIKIRISKRRYPFEDKTELNYYNDDLEPGEIREFYIRIDSDAILELEGESGEFKIFGYFKRK